MRQILLAALGTVAAIGCANVTLFASENGFQEVDDFTTGAVKNTAQVPLLNYKSFTNKDGSIEVRLDERGIKKGPKNQDVLTVFAPNVRRTEKLLHSQDWYITMDSNGATRGIYTVPRDNALPSNVLRKLGEGYGIMKVDPRNTFFKVFPSEYQLESQLTTFSEAARKTICGKSNRPETLSVTMDVKPGWSGAGRIKFNANWKTTELCKSPAAKAAAVVK